MPAKKKPVVAIMYDFDKTLSTTDMQNYSFIPKLGITNGKFWEESNALAKREHMDGLLAYMYQMIKKAKENNISVRREEFVKLGSDIEYFPGVEAWFSQINAFGQKHGVEVQHYIISSGLKEIIEGSSIYAEFMQVYACEFYYDVDKVACWPKNVVNYTGKTQFLFRINKGVLDIGEDTKLNEYTPEEERTVPFRNMIYIGDGLTDVPCMKLVKVNGGQSIAVYKKRNKKSKQVAAKLLRESRVNYYTAADYSAGSELDTIVKNCIERMAATNRLVDIHQKHMKNAEVPK